MVPDLRLSQCLSRWGWRQNPAGLPARKQAVVALREIEGPNNSGFTLMATGLFLDFGIKVSFSSS